MSYAEHLANAAYYILALMTFLAAAEKLDINFKLFEQIILIAFGGLNWAGVNTKVISSKRPQWLAY